MRPEPCVWVFHGARHNFPTQASAVFTELDKANEWIRGHSLSGTLSAFPVNDGMYDWAVRNDAITMKPEKLAKKLGDPAFIVDCLPASVDHIHYEDGVSDHPWLFS